MLQVQARASLILQVSQQKHSSTAAYNTCILDVSAINQHIYSALEAVIFKCCCMAIKLPGCATKIGASKITFELQTMDVGLKKYVLQRVYAEQ